MGANSRASELSGASTVEAPSTFDQDRTPVDAVEDLLHRKLMLTEISKLRAVVFHVMVHEAHELPRGLALGIGRERHSIRATLGRHTRETRKLLGADPAWKYHLAFSAIDIGQLRSETVNFIVVGRNGAKKKCSLELPLDSIGFKKQPPHSYRLNDCNNGHGVLVLQPWLEWYE